MLSSRRFLRYTMRYLHDYRTGKVAHDCLRLGKIRYDSSSRSIQAANFSARSEPVEKTNEDSKNFGIPDDVRQKLVYCEVLESHKTEIGYMKGKIMEMKLEKNQKQIHFQEMTSTPVYSVLLESMRQSNSQPSSKNNPYDTQENEEAIQKPVQMPYSGTNKFDVVKIEEDEEPSLPPHEKMQGLNEQYKDLYEKYLEVAKSTNSEQRYEDLVNTIDKLESSFDLTDDLSKVPPNWMTDYEVYDDTLEDENWQLNYGTPQPNAEVSAVPCGGCGALLHCKDMAIPGYLPSELFLGKNRAELQSLTCQRCHFMKHYNTSLAVNVSPDEYPKLLSSIKSKRAAVILLVDLMDFPCSIWPDILPIIGTRRPIFVVGNKVDLLPPDSPKFIEHVTNCLSKAIVEAGIHKANIKHVSLISAKSGYGIEELINKLYKLWEYKGHVYLIGCTNSGKSTLFNVLLQSDYCKSQAINLIQRATISPWPGTTLNMLKFPILKPNGSRLSQRATRLFNERKTLHMEQKRRHEMLYETRNLKYAQLIGHVGRSFTSDKPVESVDLYQPGRGKTDSTNKFGIDINHKDFKDSHWCFDTPGTVQPDQVLHLLTTDELMLTLPKTIITPRTFCLQPKHTLFLGGLGRLDYSSGDSYIRVTVFASSTLPVTICYNDDASLIYDRLLRSEAFVVPLNDPERLKQWPELMSKDFEISGIGWDVSAADIVLSSAGWVAVTPGPERLANIRAWTPEGRGIYLRTPPLLKHAVGFRGGKIRDTPAYYRGLPVYRR